MTAPYMPDPIKDVLRRHYQTNAPVVPDATSTADPRPAPPPDRTIGPQPARAPVKPMGGVLGMLMSAGETVHNAIAKRSSGYGVKDAAADVASATGASDVARGLKERSAGALAAGLLPWMIGPAGKGAQAVERVGAEALVARGAAAAARPTPMSTQAIIKNMMESGFAGGKPATAVELPRFGAGQGGSTATAMGTALKHTSRDDFRKQVYSEIAKRGGASSPEVEMAATEEVARRIASRPRPTGLLEYTRSPEVMAMREERRKLMSIPRAGGRRKGDKP